MARDVFIVIFYSSTDSEGSSRFMSIAGAEVADNRKLISRRNCFCFTVINNLRDYSDVLICMSNCTQFTVTVPKVNYLENRLAER